MPERLLEFTDGLLWASLLSSAIEGGLFPTPTTLAA
jgi:hypothetical protein